MIMFTKYVDMKSRVGVSQRQQFELAIAWPFAPAMETSPLFVSFVESAVAFKSKFLHLVIIDECLEESPFDVVRCAISPWRIRSRHQFLRISNTRPSLCNFLRVEYQIFIKLIRTFWHDWMIMLRMGIHINCATLLTDCHQFKAALFSRFEPYFPCAWHRMWLESRRQFFAVTESAGILLKKVPFSYWYIIF
jgi:hypothetical protein